VIDLKAYGAIPNGPISNGPDCTPALNSAIAAALAGDDKTIHVPAGQWMFMTPPNPISGGIRIIGEGKSDTVLTRAYSNGEFLVIVQNGSEVKDLTLWAGPGTSGGIGIHMIADNAPNGAGGNHVIEDIWITSGTGGTWAIPIYLDGLNRTIAPHGIRAVTLRDVNVFNATSWAMEWWNTVACEWYGGGAYQGAGTTQSIAVGGPLATENLIHAQIDQASSTIWTGALRSPIT
jgi:hypothetical protein